MIKLHKANFKNIKSELSDILTDDFDKENKKHSKDNDCDYNEWEAPALGDALCRAEDWEDFVEDYANYLDIEESEAAIIILNAITKLI